MFKERILQRDTESLVAILEIRLWNDVWQQDFEMTKQQPDRKKKKKLI